MNTFFNWMERYFVPIAAKIGSNRFLISIRDAFITLMPITMANAVAVLLNALVRDIPTQYGWTGITEFFAPLIAVNGAVWWGASALFSLLFVAALAYQIGKNWNVDALGTTLVALAAFFCFTPQGATGTWGNVSWTYTNVNALFSCMIIAIGASFAFVGLCKTPLKIKMPEGVPPAISKAFNAMIPGILVIYLFSILGIYLPKLLGSSLQDWISTFVQQPAMGITQNFGFIIGFALLVQLLWFFGLHGPNILGVITEGLYGTAATANGVAAGAGEALPYMFTKTSFEIFAWMGGAGCTIALIIAILVFGKKAGEKAVAKVALAPGVFNINEPVTFGVPLVLNPLYFIPFLLISPLLVSIGYFFTWIGFVPYAIPVPWVLPPILSAVLATRSWQGGVIALLNLAIAIAIWSVFVIVGNRQKDVELDAEEV